MINNLYLFGKLNFLLLNLLLLLITYNLYNVNNNMH